MKKNVNYMQVAKFIINLFITLIITDYITVLG